MNDADVSKQIQQMVRFIRQEAEEKANEISVSAEEVSLITRICTLFYPVGSFGFEKIVKNLEEGKSICITEGTELYAVVKFLVSLPAGVVVLKLLERKLASLL